MKLIRAMNGYPLRWPRRAAKAKASPRVPQIAAGLALLTGIATSTFAQSPASPSPSGQSQAGQSGAGQFPTIVWRPRQDPPPQDVQLKTPTTVISPAERALIEGKFDEVDALASAADAPADIQVIKARADRARGRYDAARTTLQTLAAADPAGEAALELGFLLDALGKRAEAATHWTAVASARASGDPPRLVRGARALAALGGRARQASSMFQEASRQAPDDPRIHTVWGELFVAKHNSAEAIELFAAALKADPRWVPALVGLARAQAETDGDAARASLERALSISPASVDGRLLLAELALDERRLDVARAEIERALGANPHGLEALSLQAALAVVEDRTADAAPLIAGVLEVNPTYGDVYRAIGAQLAAHYRFDEAVAQLRKGVELDPLNPRIQAELGLHLLRTGDEPAARTALDAAFKADPYDLVTYNLLSMLDTLDKFETFTEGEFVVRMPPEEAKVLSGALLSLAARAIRDLSGRYNFTPKGPLLIEMFNRHDDFAVRTLGLPGMVGALGACFGRVVTLDSPRARSAPGSFNWEATLWHELAHVITLQMSAQRMPRWLSEGASVFEERRASPSWGREGEHDFLRAYARGELIPLAMLNTGFSSVRTINLAYHQSSLVVEHLVERFGDAGLQRLIKAFADGRSEEAALSDTLGLSVDGLQSSFDQFVARKFAATKSAFEPVEEPLPNGPEVTAQTIQAFADKYAKSYEVQVRAGRLLFDREDLEGARRLLERAVELLPQTMGDESARVGLAEILAKQGDDERAARELEQVLADGHTALDAARRLQGLAAEHGDQARQQRAIERIITLDPFDAAAYAELGRLALARQDVPAAIRSLELTLALGPDDKATAHSDLAEAYLASGQPDQVRRHAIAALEIAPRYERAQELLLRVIDGR